MILDPKIVCCPKCHKGLNFGKKATCSSCSSSYPVIDNVPLLITEEKSVFRFKQIEREWSEQKFHKDIFTNKLFRLINRITPTLYSERRHRQIAQRFLEEINKIRQRKINVLSIGNGTGGIVFDQLKQLKNVNFIETDVFVSANRQFVSDIHNLPVKSGCVDVVLVEGVLEHVIDPIKASSEIWRVLRPHGLLLCTIPFILGVHTETADYQRYTRLGLIRLFHQFRLVECESVEGTYTALAYQTSYTFMTIATSMFKGVAGEIALTIAKYFGNYLLFWLKYLDLVVRHNPISKDSALNHYYIGYKTNTTLNDTEINLLFNGRGVSPK